MSPRAVPAVRNMVRTADRLTHQVAHVVRNSRRMETVESGRIGWGRTEMDGVIFRILFILS